MANLTSLIVNDTGYIKLPTGTAAQRPPTETSKLRYNSTTASIEICDNSNRWKNRFGTTLEYSTTGNVITTYDNDYKILIFTGSGSLTVTQGGDVQFLIVGGGGGGGMDMGGGGGGGGVIEGNATLTPQTYTITVGDGGAGAPAAGTNGQPSAHQYTIPATNGGNSSAFGYTAVGGGHGGSSYVGYTPDYGLGASGGSGGGASGYGTSGGGGAGTAGQGYNGGGGGGSYYSGGGGGAGGVGVSGTAQPDGGPGKLINILGIPLYWAAGGGGASYSLATGGNGGIGGGGGGAVGTTSGGARGYNIGCAGGGGSSGSQTNRPGGNGAKNTGSGGGGGSHYNSNNKGGDGGSGIVIVKFKSPELADNNRIYVPLNFTINGADILTANNGSTCVDIYKGTGTNGWTQEAYCLTPFTAPVTLEFNKIADTNNTDNGLSYAMISLNTDPQTDASYSSLDFASYPYYQPSYVLYNNGSGINTGIAWDGSKKFRIVYDTDGNIRHYNGSTLLYTGYLGTGQTVYVDTSFYSVSSIYCAFRNIRVIKKSWNGTTYV